MNEELRKRVIAYNVQVATQREVYEVVKELGITIASKPSIPPDRPGMKWIPYQGKTGGPISWVESEYDSTLPGTVETPIGYSEGLTVYPNYYYILDGVCKVWMDSEICMGPDWGDERFVEF